MSLDERLRSLQEVSARVPVGDVEVALRRVHSTPVRRSRRRRLLAVVALAAAVAVVVGVTRILPEDRETNVTTEEGSSPWQSLVRSAPAPDGGFVIHDFARLADAIGVTKPGPEATDEEVDAYREAVWNTPDLQLYTNLPLGRASAADVRNELGFDHRAVDRVLTFTYPQPMNSFDVLVGRFDPAKIEQALEADSRWSPSLTTDSYKGSTYYTWGDERQNITSRSPLRPLGVGARLLVTPQSLVWSNLTSNIESAIDARAGAKRTATDDAVQQVVGHLDRQGTVSAMVNSPALDLEADVQAFGLGYHRAASGSWIVELAIAYTTPEAARQGRVRLQERLDADELRAARPVADTLAPLDVSVAGELLTGSFTYTNDDVPVGHSLSARGAVGSLLPMKSTSTSTTSP